MLRDITLGQYYQVDSVIHRLDPRPKIIATLLFIIELFMVKDFIGFAMTAAYLAVIVSLSKVPLKFILRGLKAIFIILIFTFCLNIFMVEGQIIWQWRFLKITVEGIRTAAFMGIRLVLLIIGSSLLTLTTKPLALTDGMEQLLSPFKKIGLPAHEIAMMMSIALRFIPTLLEETDKIMKAQMARGADFESGNLIKRAKSLVPLLIPLFVSAFRIAQDLAMAMEARCYHGGVGRTRMNAMEMGKKDYVAFGCMAGFLVLLILELIFV